MALHLHNTLTRRKEAFEPLDPSHVRMYVCGPTVYDFAHIGNARPVVVFDVLFRLLRRLYPKVTYARNITDVDDRIMDAARTSGEPIGAITERTTRAYHEDMRALGAFDEETAPGAFIEPRATQHIGKMIAMIEALIARGNAYAAEGHVLFSVPTMSDYGKLSGRSRDELIAGARVEVAPYKKDPADFVLWKPSTPDQPGWDSPWGRGRPGWHIECSAMSETHLGRTFDIHGGGHDLIFPHHENEIAQSECAHGAPFVRYWVHNGFLVVNGEKMSKSLGNFFTVRDLIGDDWRNGEAIRLLLLKTHYRAPLDFTKDGLREAKANLDRWYRALLVRDTWPEVRSKVGDSEPTKPILEALYDDLNTPDAIAHLNGLANAIFHGERAGNIAEIADLTSELRASASLLGLLQHDPERWFKGGANVPLEARGSLGLRGRVSLGIESSVVLVSDEQTIERLIAERNVARKAKDFKEADRIRDDLKNRGVILEDGPKGTTWKRAG